MDTMKRVADLRPDDLVDLERDIFADPNRNHPALEFEYQRVDTVEVETPQCVAVWFDGFDCVGFPPDHLVRVADPDFYGPVNVEHSPPYGPRGQR